MFSQEPRRFLKKNQLMEVICQFRFPEILASAAKSSQEVYRELAREMNLLVRLTRQLPSAAAN